MVITEEKKDTTYKEWMCPKCGLMRNNKVTHNHGVPMLERSDVDEKVGELREGEQKG